ncbi:tetratricopeptide repeat protein [uncultured Erythrobacter sp.]|uniref:tetratricopeptide repeat protein n=1 Tax=uncultured Erythrobacter sp. TaxID=263913 RepID=UPI00263A048F|nr:tetratricopeptide repeat protein [uncultured Erythrobacter sp.]
MLSRLAKVIGLEIPKPKVNAMIARGDAARDRKSWRKASDAYAEALEIAPFLTHIRVQFGHMLKEDGRVEEAVAAYQHAAADDPDNADIRVNLAHALKRLGRNEEAIGAFRDAINLNPADRESVDEIFHLSQNLTSVVSSAQAQGKVDLSGLTMTLEDLSEIIRPGISVVTCARNRTDNLLRALPSWLAYQAVNEVIIVDWTSLEPVDEALKNAGFSDPRIKVIRIEDETRWILSTAFNAGFRTASYDKILKADADIILGDGFFDKNQLKEGSFVAGDWRDAEPGQEFINGFFYVSRDDLMSVNGFNEFITTYGWDDDDLYDRLEEAGCKRISVDVSTITHLPHDDVARLEAQTKEYISARGQFWQQTSSKINANRFMCFLLPGWRKSFGLQQFAIKSVNDRLFVGKRSAPRPAVVPSKVRQDAERYAITEFLSGKVGLLAYELTQDQTDVLMSVSSLDAVTALSTVLVRRHPDRLNIDSKYLIIRLDDDIKEGEDLLLSALDALESKAEEAGFSLVVLDASADLLDDRYKGHTTVPFLAYPSASAAITMEQLADLEEIDAKPGECRQFYLTAAIASELIGGKPAAPALSVKRDILYIDAQHGLGNRLRAIASCASIAKKSGRELVIVWEPDHHCNCSFLDLFDYSGALIQESFLEEAKSKGMTTLNYMEIEEDSTRGTPLVLEDGVPAYARSAYVLEHPFSEWRRENHFLRCLKPSRNVLDLVDKVPERSDVSLHVRMEGAASTEIHSYDSPENWPEHDHTTIQEWRDKSHFSNFMNCVDELIEAGEAQTFFLAADLPETYAAFLKKYGDRIRFLERTHFDRSRDQMWYALADAILLSRSNTMLGSNWSSFSEIALRLSTRFDHIQLCGKDF